MTNQRRCSAVYLQYCNSKQALINEENKDMYSVLIANPENCMNCNARQANIYRI